MSNKRRRTSSDVDSEESDDSEQFPMTPAIRKRKKLDPVCNFAIVVLLIFLIIPFSLFLDGTMSNSLRINS